MAPWGDYMFASLMAFGDQKYFNVAVGLKYMLQRETIYHDAVAVGVFERPYKNFVIIIVIVVNQVFFQKRNLAAAGKSRKRQKSGNQTAN